MTKLPLAEAECEPQLITPDDVYWTKEAIYVRLAADMRSQPRLPKHWRLTAQQRAANRWRKRPIEALEQDAERARVALLEERERKLEMSVRKAISNMKPKVEAV